MSTASPASQDLVPDWLLGGNRKRLVLEALAFRRPKTGWTVAELVAQKVCAQATAYEIIRGLKQLGIIESLPGGAVTLRQDMRLVQALVGVLEAVRPLAEVSVDRPPRARGPT